MAELRYRSAIARVLVLAVALCWLLSLALGGLGELVPPLLHGELGRTAWPIARILLAILLIAVWRFFWGRAPLPRGSGLVLALVVALRFGGGYVVDQRRGAPQTASFGGLATLTPNQTFRLSVAGGPEIAYTTNSLGLRGPDFERIKRPGVVRIVVVGDSFVFGHGVELEDTLPRQLEAVLARSHPGRAFEVLNLGIKGDNLPSHVDAVAAAAEMLGPDVIVLCLTLPNDLTRWDRQDERRANGRVSLFSVSRYLFGVAATTNLWGYAFGGRLDAQALRVLDEEVDRLAAIRARAADRAPLLVFMYGYKDTAVLSRLRRLGEPGDVVLVPPHPDAEQGWYIPGDGHPNAAGNRAFAQMIAGSLEEVPRLRAIMASTP